MAFSGIRRALNRSIKTAAKPTTAPPRQLTPPKPAASPVFEEPEPVATTPRPKADNSNTSALDRRFALAEQRLQQQERGRISEEQDALKRRFASIGATGSGASIKAAQQAEQAGSSRLAQGKGALEIARLGEEQRLGEIESAREFQRGEREAGQLFAGGQAALGRRFSSFERAAGETFAGRQAEIGRDFAEKQARLGREFTTGEREAAQIFNKGLADREFELNKLISMANLGMAQQQLDENKKGMLAGILGNDFGGGGGFKSIPAIQGLSNTPLARGFSAGMSRL